MPKKSLSTQKQFYESAGSDCTGDFSLTYAEEKPTIWQRFCAWLKGSE